jgi:peptidoglycan hydrolase-like protein with peptidoglycan-binding domain
MRALILALSIVGIVASVTCAEAGLSSTPREPLAGADTAIQTAENQIGLTKTKRREVQRDLIRLGYETKDSGKFDDSTRAAIASWQDEHGYPKTGFLDVTQHKALLQEGAAAKTSENDNLDHRRGRRHVHRTRVVGGPFGVIGDAIGGLFRR